MHGEGVVGVAQHKARFIVPLRSVPEVDLRDPGLRVRKKTWKRGI
jgi:hypothetical protein